MLKIQHPQTKEIVELNQFWLRDHCHCKACYNYETKQRAFNILDISENIECLKSSIINSTNELHITWSDGHESVYDFDFLKHAQKRTIRSSSSSTNQSKQVLWNATDISEMYFKDINFQFNDLMVTDSCVTNVVTALVRFGVALINGVPPNTDATQMTVRRLFPIMKTLFGEMYTFSDHLDHADTAYSKEYLSAHTDNTYFCDAAGLQVFHCLEHTNGNGGENFFIDAFKAAIELKHDDPVAYNQLCTVLVPAEYVEDGEHHYYSAPIIRTDPLTEEIVQIRLNVYDRAVFNTLPQQDMEAFYKNFRKFLLVIEDEKNQWNFKLEPKTVIIIDNWRVLHGRKAYTGQRTMTGCYVQRTDFMSKARILKIID